MKKIITNANQDGYRERLKKFAFEKGVRWSFISDKIGTPYYVLSAFRYGRKNMYDESISKLEAFLQSEGY